MKTGTIPLTDVLLLLNKSKTEVVKALAETKQSIDALERKPSMSKTEELRYDKLWFQHDALEEEIDNVDGAIMLLSKYT